MNLNFLKTQFFLIATLAVASASTASAQTYRVTIQNLTKNQTFQGIHTRIHGSRTPLFQTGELLPESSLSFFRFVQFQTEPESISLPSGGILPLEVRGRKRSKFFSWISPLHATDDGFVGINSVRLPTKRNKVVTVYAKVYDAGLFENTESCEDNTILTSLRPPEECSQEIKEVTLQPKNPIVIHNGIHGIGDLNSAKYDWRNPVAKVTIRKL